MIVYAQGLHESALEWSAYRGSANGGAWRIDLFEVAAPPSTDAAALDAQRSNIRRLIRDAHKAAAPVDAAHFAVLLLGDDDVLPAWRFPQSDPVLMDDDRLYISDQPYQLLEDDDVIPSFALGRVPARSNDDARRLLAKIKSNETAASDVAPSDRITYVAGEGHFGPLDVLLETLFVMMVDHFVPDAFDLSMTYAKAASPYCPPPSKLTDTVLAQLSEGGLLFNYVGHGWERGFDSLHWNGQRIPILRVGDLARLDADVAPAGQRPVAFMSCCSVGHFDLANGEPCLSEALLFSLAGPIAIISGSRITHPYANTVLQKDISRALLVDRASTAGMLDLMADRSLLKQDADDRELDFIAGTLARSQKWATSLQDLRVMHARMYNLLGDPATRLNLPTIGVRDLALHDGRLTGSAPGIAIGRVLVRLETPRTGIAQPSKLIAVHGDNDPDLERKAANNYPLANDRLLREVAGEIKDGRFAIDLGALPKDVGVLRIQVKWADDEGIQHEALGALRLPASP